MKITIDVLDGNGPQDYSAAIEAGHPVEIVRKLNKPSVCLFGILCTDNTVPSLLRNGRVVIASDGGASYFTGYLATEPAMEYMGGGTAGGAYIAVVSAISDEILLDRQVLSRNSSGFDQPISVLMKNLMPCAGASVINSDAVVSPEIVGSFITEQAKTWSTNAGLLASSARMSYRVLDANLTLNSIGSTIHEESEADGTLTVKALSVSKAKMLVNDVTVCGEEEPAAYVTEFFQGDGATALFELGVKPFTPAGISKALAEDQFNGSGINADIWQVVDQGGHITQTSVGLTFNSGSGVGGQTYVSSMDSWEMGGSLLVEADGILLDAGSDGFLCSLSDGPVGESSCLAGFRVKQVLGVTNLVPIVGGVEAGCTFPAIAGHLYSLRLRLYSPEQQRVLESYCSVGDAGVGRWGGDLIPAAGSLVLEVQETINGVPAPVVVLYDGTVSQVAAVCNLVVGSGINLAGSVRSILVQKRSPVRIRTAGANGSWATARVGTSATTGDCRVETTGSILFFPGSIPAVGETVVVNYRTSKRAIARLSQANSISLETAVGIPGTSRWAGRLTRPKARSSADCENGARAILNASCSRMAATEGKFVKVVNPCDMQIGDDIWPGDLLALDSVSGGDETRVVVRAVKVEALLTSPQLLRYTIDFANDWASELSLSLTSTVAADAWMPLVAGVPVLDSLTGLSATIANESIAVDAGVSPPVAGGFEVRRTDWTFGPGTDSDLVLRSPAQHFGIPRLAAGEQYYIRMYDGSTPPVYSRMSSAILINIPM